MMHIRPARSSDVGLILAFIRELAEYERAPDQVTATEADLLRDGFGERPLFHALIAEHGGEPAGFAFYFFAYSTWQAKATLYLEDLFVRPRFRKLGIGLALMKRLAAEAVHHGCGRFRWQVLDWNEPSIRFYESLGARTLREWLTCQLDGAALAALCSADK
jgi:GNAT superfamily N-acetyltransferase